MFGALLAGGTNIKTNEYTTKQCVTHLPQFFDIVLTGSDVDAGDLTESNQLYT